MKSRDFQSKFFTDPYVQELTLREKFVYIYYLYNERVNWLGTYEVSDRTACFEIGDIGQTELQKIKTKFTDERKIFFINSWVIIRNSDRYDPHLGNRQLMRSALSQFKSLPEDIKKAFLTFKPKEIIDVYKKMFEELGCNLDSSLLVAYEYPTSSQPVAEYKSNNIKDKRNKIKDKEDTAYQEIISHFNQTFEKQTKSYASWKTNCDLHLKSYSLDDIKQAITNWKQHGDKFWAKEPSLDLLFRTKNKNGQPCDYIDQLLNLKSARKLEADPLAGLVKKGNYVGN